MAAGKFVTVKTFTYPHELAVVKGRLEAEGIECFVMDENTVQVNPLYSNVVGGVKLQVRENDLQRAIELLMEAGYYEYAKQPRTQLYRSFENITSKIPLLKLLGVELRLYALIALVVIIIVPVLFVSNQPSEYARLTENTWCLDYLEYDGKTYRPHTTGFSIQITNQCSEQFSLHNDEIYLPGFNSQPAKATWQFYQNRLRFTADTLQHIYNHNFRIEMSNFGKQLVLIAGSIKIHCHALPTRVRLPL